jgi:O6-methylguanine-DNA--protein-cysteine methyltransferase
MTRGLQTTAPLVNRIFLTWKWISPLKLHLRGTNFQIKVWEALLKHSIGRIDHI